MRRGPTPPQPDTAYTQRLVRLAIHHCRQLHDVEMAEYAWLSSPVSVSLLVGLATFCGTVFVKLYRARMLLVERRRQGLVKS